MHARNAMKRSHLSNFDLPLSPPAAIHSRYRSVSVTVLLDVNVILDVIADSVFLALSAVSPRSLRIVRASYLPVTWLFLEFWGRLAFNEDYISLNE